MVGLSDVRSIFDKHAWKAIVVVVLAGSVGFLAFWRPAWSAQAARDKAQDVQIDVLKAQDGKLDEILRRLPEPEP